MTVQKIITTNKKHEKKNHTHTQEKTQTQIPGRQTTQVGRHTAPPGQKSLQEGRKTNLILIRWESSLAVLSLGSIRTRSSCFRRTRRLPPPQQRGTAARRPPVTMLQCALCERVSVCALVREDTRRLFECAYECVMCVRPLENWSQ